MIRKYEDWTAEEKDEYRNTVYKSSWREIDANKAIEIATREVSSDDRKKAPTHEEIMTKWWKGYNNIWAKVKGYVVDDTGMPYLVPDPGWVSKDWFTNRESADIPPEE